MNLDDVLAQAKFRADLTVDPIGTMTSVVDKANSVLASDPTEKERRDLLRSLRNNLDANTRLVSMIDPASIKSLELAIY